MNAQRLVSWGLAAVCVALAGCASTGNPTPTSSVPVASKSGNSSSNQKVRALVELDSLRREVALLRNQVEIQENELDKLRKRQRDLYDDLDHRLRARERLSGPRLAQPAPGRQPDLATGAHTGMAPAPQAGMTPGTLPGTLAPPVDSTATPGAAAAPGLPPAYPAQAAAEPAQPGLGAPQQPPLPGATEQPAADGAMPVPAAPAAPPAQVAVATAAEQAAYDSAFEMLKQGRYGEAIAAFENMIAQYPNGALADDSQYWVGEAWYVTRDYEQALGVFKQVVERYPDSPRVPEALLKIGYVQNEVGAKAEACRTFADVITRYPGSRVAISAQTRRKRLELDGHCS